jgi:uncharacterized protein (DUF433 family)
MSCLLGDCLLDIHCARVDREMNPIHLYTDNSDVMRERACIRDTRVTLSLIINLVANETDFEEILEAYPYLEPNDIQQALQYVAWLAEENVFALELAA